MGQAQTISAEFLKMSCTADGCCERRGFPDRLADTVKIDATCLAGGGKDKENILPEESTDRFNDEESFQPCTSFAPCQTLPKEVSPSDCRGYPNPSVQTPEKPARQPGSVFSSRCTEPEGEEQLSGTPPTRPGMMPQIMPPQTRLATISTVRQGPVKETAHIWEQEPSPEPVANSARQRDDQQQAEPAPSGPVGIEHVLAAMSASGASPCASTPGVFHSARGSPLGFGCSPPNFGSPAASWSTAMSPGGEPRDPEHLLATPPRHRDSNGADMSQRTDGGRMQEAQALLASMLSPADGSPDAGSKRRRRSRRRSTGSTTPRANAADGVSDRRSRASSCASTAPSEEPQRRPSPPATLRPLNGTMPQFPSADLKTPEQHREQQPSRAQPRAAGRWLRAQVNVAG